MPRCMSFLVVGTPVSANRFFRGLLRLASLGALAVSSGCTMSEDISTQPVDPMILAMYAPVRDEPFPVPAIPVNRMDPALFRQLVATPPQVPGEPGTVVIDTQARFLYLVQPGDRSLRYAIGVGRQGFSWAGDAEIWDKQQWPKWFPPAEMMERDPYAAQYPDGMDGGSKNPLGSRAMYLYEGDCNEGNLRTASCRDTLFRIHATNEPMSIGKAVSSGCIRMWNQDIIDLYDRVPIGTKVMVLGMPEATPPERSTMVVGPTIDSGQSGGPAAGRERIQDEAI